MPKRKEGKKIRTKKGVNPFTGAILTVPAEKNDHQKLEEEVFKASMQVMKDMQPYFELSEEVEKEAKKKRESPFAPRFGPHPIVIGPDPSDPPRLFPHFGQAP